MTCLNVYTIGDRQAVVLVPTNEKLGSVTVDQAVATIEASITAFRLEDGARIIVNFHCNAVMTTTAWIECLLCVSAVDSLEISTDWYHCASQVVSPAQAASLRRVCGTGSGTCHPRHLYVIGHVPRWIAAVLAAIGATGNRRTTSYTSRSCCDLPVALPNLAIVNDSNCTTRGLCQIRAHLTRPLTKLFIVEKGDGLVIVPPGMLDRGSTLIVGHASVVCPDPIGCLRYTEFKSCAAARACSVHLPTHYKDLDIDLEAAQLNGPIVALDKPRCMINPSEIDYDLAVFEKVEVLWVETPVSSEQGHGLARRLRHLLVIHAERHQLWFTPRLRASSSPSLVLRATRACSRNGYAAQSTRIGLGRLAYAMAAADQLLVPSAMASIAKALFRSMVFVPCIKVGGTLSLYTYPWSNV